MITCALCLFPRSSTQDAPTTGSCGICGSSETLPPGPESGDFALRMAADGRLSVAYASLEQKIAADQATAEDCLHLAWLAFAFKDFRAVEVWSHECERLDPASPEPHLLLATVLDRGERWQEAVDEYDVALRRAAHLHASRRELIETNRASSLSRIPEW